MLDLSACESPLEVAFGRALFDVFGNGLVPEPRSPRGIIATIPGWDSVLASQLDLHWCRPDFMLCSIVRFKLEEFGVDQSTIDRAGPDNTVVIEVDGHEFHERTKEQARRDRSRDRAMAASGIVVLRFTGQEVHQDANACASEALEVFIERQRKVLNSCVVAYALWCQRNGIDHSGRR